MTEGDGAGPQAGKSRDRLTTRVSLAVIAGALMIVAFFVGSRLGPAVDEPVKTPSVTHAATTTPTKRAAPAPAATVGPIADGVHPWNALLGTECLNPYTSPWQASFTVVSCRKAHMGQMTKRVSLTEASYPGSATLIASLSLTCSGPSAVRLSAAAHYSDIRINFSYPTAGEWSAGDTSGYCFVSRANDGSLTETLAAG